ncbi:protein of unknown function DUF551 [Vibrio phage 1.123.O._10N.286.48.F3]|nr:protein of unknown function DUF551 [Vibrio phage 1.123.O._10N.286.48.F3]
MEITAKTCVCGSDRDELAQIVKTMPKWVSVDERLPIQKREMEGLKYKTVDVIVTDGEVVYVDEFCAGNTQGFWSSFSAGEITHWMPLPEPPTSK